MILKREKPQYEAFSDEMINLRTDSQKTSKTISVNACIFGKIIPIFMYFPFCDEVLLHVIARAFCETSQCHGICMTYDDVNKGIVIH